MSTKTELLKDILAKIEFDVDSLPDNLETTLLKAIAENVSSDSEGGSEESTGGFAPELIWENPTPKEDFAAQTITFDGTYKAYIIINKPKKTSTGNFSSVFLPVATESQCNVIVSHNTKLVDGDFKASISYNMRPVTCSENSIVFGDGAYVSVGYVEENELFNTISCVPLRIYGIK